MSIRELFSGYVEFTSASELSATRGQSLHANRVTTTVGRFASECATPADPAGDPDAGPADTTS